MKNPSPDLTDDQAATLRKIKRRGGDLWRAYVSGSSSTAPTDFTPPTQPSA